MAAIDPPLFGPGSQPEDQDGGTLEYMTMPSGMMTYAAPAIPEADEAAGLDAGKGALERVLEALRDFTKSGASRRIDLEGLGKDDLELVNQMLGEGEVSVIGGNRYQAQESVFTGVWRIRETDETGMLSRDYVEVSLFPAAIAASVFDKARGEVETPPEFGPNVFNAPPLIAEINEHLDKAGNGNGPHVINLSLLPHTEEDLAFLSDILGRNGVTILSRGYGNCRITGTMTRNVWWVQFYNSQEAMILNTIEITPVPEVACASVEDIADSAERLDEVLELYR